MTVLKEFLAVAVDSMEDFSLASNLNNLAAGAVKPLGGHSANDYVDNRSYYAHNAQLLLQFDVSSAVAAGDTVDLYLQECLFLPGSSSHWSDRIAPDGTTDVSSDIVTVQPFHSLPVERPGADVTWVCSDLKQLIGKNLPPYWTILARNATGGALGAVTNKAKFRLLSYEV